MGSQENRFRNAMANSLKCLGPNQVNFELLNLKELRESCYTLSGFVDWLLESHIHFVITHPHQGTESFGWSICDFYKELQRLKYHVGFPHKDELCCPIFTQDKWQYLQALPSSAIMATYKIPIYPGISFDTIASCVDR